MLRNLTTSARLLLLAASAVISIGVIGLLGVFEISSMGGELRQDLDAARIENAAMLEVKTTQAMFLLQVKAFKDVLLRGNNEESYDKHLKEFKDRQADVITHLTAAIGWMKEAGVATDDAEALKTAHAELSAKYLDALTGFEKGDPEAGKKSDKQVRGIDRPTNEKLSKLVADMEKRAAERTAARLGIAAQSASRTKWIFSVIVLVGFVAMISMSALIHRQLMGQLGGDPAYAAKIVAGIAQGNLTEPIELRRGDNTSLLACMQQMQTGLRRVIEDISHAAETMGDSSKQLAATAHQVAGGAHQQSESSASMAASIEELSYSIKQVAESSSSAHDLSDQARQCSQVGAEHIRRTIQNINGAASSMQEAMQAVYRLGEQSAAISSILDAIREIADQTNLLALNAAIEAARAGEQGRGFAVVADEVRKLAEKTGASTREIADMIVAIQEGVQIAVRQMENGTAEVQLGMTSAADTGKAMQEIGENANRVLAAVDDISTALQEQSESAGEISRNVEATAQLAEENGAAVDEVSSATAYLDELAQKLKQSVHSFRT